MEVCKCGHRLNNHMVKEGKKSSCKSCGRESIDERYAKENTDE